MNMWTSLLTSLVFGGGVAYAYFWKPAFVKDPHTRTIIDVYTMEDIFRFLDHVTRPTDDCDALSEKIVRMYQRFPPSDRCMRAVTALHESHSGTGGREDYACTMVYTLMMLAVMETL